MLFRFLSICFLSIILFAGEYEDIQKLINAKKVAKIKKNDIKNKSLAFDLVNEYRKKVFLNILETNPLLDASAMGHCKYVNANKIRGHYQQKGKKFFTGVSPKDRTAFAKYASTDVSENLSGGHRPVAIESIDGLFSAIYHRHIFFRNYFSEMGVGVENQVFTYNLGNKNLRILCENGQGVSGVPSCINGASIPSDKYLKTKNDIKSKNPPIVVWPADGGEDVYPVFFHENPDPLPNARVSGYPISIEFNDYYFSDVSLFGIVVTDSKGVEIKGLFMNSDNDPNGRFSKLQYAFFPDERLDFGSVYHVKFTYDATPTYFYGGKNTHSLTTVFKTRTIKNKLINYYDFNGKDIPIVSGGSYTLYAKPKNNQDWLFDRGYSERGDFVQKLTGIDVNSFSFSLEGRIGEKYIVDNLKGFRITFVVSQKDSDKLVVKNENFTQKDIDLIALNNAKYINPLPSEIPPAQTQEIQKVAKIKNQKFAILYKKGWNFLTPIVDKDIVVAPTNGEYKLSSLGNPKDIYVFRNANFTLSPSVIKVGEGFMLYAKNDGKSNEVKGNEYDFKAVVSKGWNFLGVSKEYQTLELNGVFKTDMIFVLRDGKYIKSPMSLKAGEGFLLHR